MGVYQQITMSALFSLMCSYSLATSLNRFETHKGTMYIIGLVRTEKLTMNGRILNHVSTKEHSDSEGCNGCAYTKHGQDLYMAGHYDETPYTQTSILTADGTRTAQPDLPTEGDYLPFSFIIDGRQYVGGLNSNKLYSRALSMGSWVREANISGSMMWTARSGMVSEGVVYITGGTDTNESASNAAWSWSPGQSVWHQLPSMEHTHFQHCNVMVNSDIFVVGGSTGGWSASRYIEVYNLHTQTWSQRSPAPYDMPSTPSCAALGTNIYVHYEDKVYLYDTVTLSVEDSWSTIYTMDNAMGGDGGTAMLIV